MSRDQYRDHVTLVLHQERYIVSLAVCNIAKSFASVEKVVTVSCLFALYATASPNNFII